MADKARVKAEAAAAKAQAESASRTAELLIDQQKEKEEKGEEGVEDDIKKEIADLKKRLEAVSNSCYSLITEKPSNYRYKTVSRHKRGPHLKKKQQKKPKIN